MNIADVLDGETLPMIEGCRITNVEGIGSHKISNEAFDVLWRDNFVTGHTDFVFGYGRAWGRGGKRSLPDWHADFARRLADAQKRFAERVR